MEERADFKYITDIMPAANAEFAEKFAGRYFQLLRRWVLKLPKQISMPVLLLLNKLWAS